MKIEEYIEEKKTDLNEIVEWGEEIFGEGNIDVQINEDLIPNYKDTDYSISEYDSLIYSFATIYIYFSEKTVVNENNDRHKIYDGYIKINVSPRMTLNSGPVFTRSSLTIRELKAKYIFSHCPSMSLAALINLSNSGSTTFLSCCFGTGPIRTSMSRLSQDSSETNWKLFFNDLNNYFEVESLEGGPYIHMSRITNPDSQFMNFTVNDFVPLSLSENAKTLFYKFIDYLYDNKWFESLEFINDEGFINYSNVSMSSLYEDISKLFFRFIETLKEENSELLSSIDTLISEYIDIRNIGVELSSYDDAQNYLNQNNTSIETSFPLPLNFTFKGNPVFLTIREEEPDSDSNIKKGFNVPLFNRLMYSLTKLLKYKLSYGQAAYL